jgi:acyl-CoA synthetase (AMP-forming)/AMP-acid ligase II
MRKSSDTVAVIYGILKAGAAYVPVDSTAPPARDAYIMHNCAVKAVVIESRLAGKFRAEYEQLGTAPEFLLLDGVGGGDSLRKALDDAD